MRLDSSAAGQWCGLAAAAVLHSAVALGASQLSPSSRQPLSVPLEVSVVVVKSSVAPPSPTPPPAPEPPPSPQRSPLTERRPPAKARASEAKPARGPSEAARVLTQEPVADAPLDFTDDEFVSGGGVRFAGGVTQARGRSKRLGSRARPAPASPAKPGEERTSRTRDRSRPALPARGSNWNSCGFPSEANRAQIDNAAARIVVTVDRRGKPRSVTVLSDPGYGFGQLARVCAYRMRYRPGRDADGRLAIKSTPPIRVRFTR